MAHPTLNQIVKKTEMAPRGTKIKYEDIQTGDILEYWLDMQVIRCTAVRMYSSDIKFVGFQGKYIPLPDVRDYYLVHRTVTEPMGLGAVVRINGVLYTRVTMGTHYAVADKTWRSFITGKSYSWVEMLEHGHVEVLSHGVEL